MKFIRVNYIFIGMRPYGDPKIKFVWAQPKVDNINTNMKIWIISGTEKWYQEQGFTLCASILLMSR